MPHSCRKVEFCVNSGADPLVRAGRPRPALVSKNQVVAFPVTSRPGGRLRTRGPAPEFTQSPGNGKTTRQ